MKNFIISVFVLFTVIFVECACSQTVKIGMFGPFSGPVADSGVAMSNGVNLAIEEINRNGGIKGVGKIQIISADSEYNPSVAVNAVNKLIYRDKVCALIGDIGSGPTLATMKISSKANIPQITPTSASPLITQKGNQFIFRTAVGDHVAGAEAARFAVEELNSTKIAIMHASDDYGKDGADVVEQTLENLGTPAVVRAQFTMGDKDFSGQLLKIKQAAPEVVIFWGLYFDAASVLRQAHNLVIAFHVVGCDPLVYPKMIELGGEHANGIIGITMYCPNDPNPKVQAFAKKYYEKYNDESDPSTALSYDTAYILAKAIEKAQSTDPLKIRDALYKTDYEGVTGRTIFQDNGEPLKEVFPVVIKNGRLELYSK